MLLPGIDDAMEPVLAKPGPPVRAILQVFGRACQQNSYRLLRRRCSESFCYRVSPELHAHHANCGSACGVGNAGDVNIEGANGKVSIADRGWDEGLQDVRGGVICS